MKNHYYLYNNRDIGQSYRNKNYYDEVKSKVISNGIILPLKDKKGGVVYSDGKFVKESFHDGEWFKYGGNYPFSTVDIDFIDRKVVYLGVFIKQWGHYLLDSLSRCWILDKINLKYMKFAFISNQDKISGNYLKVMDLLGIKKDDLLIIKKPTKFQEVIIPDMCVSPNRGYTKEYPKIFKRIVNNANIRKYRVPDKIYLSRTKLKIAQKKEFGEKIIEANFKANGYTVMYPENMTLLEQIAIFNNSREIVCLNGSIPFGIIFAGSSLDLIILNKTSMPHFNLFELIDASSIFPTFIDCYYEPFQKLPLNLGEGPFLLIFSKKLKCFFNERKLKYNLFCRANYFSILNRYLYACLKAYVKILYRKLKS